MAAPTPLGVHQIASGETYALVADLNRVGITADAAIGFVKARAEYLTDKAVADAGALSQRALNELPGRVVAEVDRVIGDTREDAAEALATANKAYEYNQALVAPAADVVNAVVTDPATPAGSAVASKEPSATAMRLGERDVDLVRQYGADPSGSASSLTPLQNAVKAAADGGRRRIYLPPGRYSIPAGRVLLTVPGLIIEGAGPDETVIVGNSMLEAASNDVTIRNLTIEGTGEARLSNVLRKNATPRQLKNWRFENVRFKDTALHTGIVGAPTPAMGTGLPGSTPSGTGLHQHIEVDHCEFTGYAADGAFWCQGSDFVTVNRCHFHDIGTPPSSQGGTNMTGDMCKFSYQAKNGRVLHSTFANGHRDAVDLYDAAQVTVDGNSMTDMAVCAVEAKWGYRDEHARRHKIVNNIATRCGTGIGQYGVVFQVSVPEITVMNNTAIDCTGTGFRTGGAMDNSAYRTVGGQIIGNQVLGTTGQGFAVRDVTNTILVGNIATGTGLQGFYIPSSVVTNVRAASNISYGNAYADDWTGVSA